MSNKEQIRKLHDNSELAMVSYRYFHLVESLKGYAYDIFSDIVESHYPSYSFISHIQAYI